MKVKDYIITFLFYAMLLALMGFWWCQLNDTVHTYHTKYLEIEQQNQQSHDIQVQSALRIHDLEQKVDSLEKELLDLRVKQFTP